MSYPAGGFVVGASQKFGTIDEGKAAVVGVLPDGGRVAAEDVLNVVAAAVERLIAIGTVAIVKSVALGGERG